jgi:hypothetical protein
MKIADFRIQTTAPGAPSSSSVIGVYADASGVLISKTSAGVTAQVGSQFLGTYLNTAVVSGGTSCLGTGAYWGPTVGTANPATGLAVPNKWLQVDISGTKYAVPAYSLR